LAGVSAPSEQTVHGPGAVHRARATGADFRSDCTRAIDRVHAGSRQPPPFGLPKLRAGIQRERSFVASVFNEAADRCRRVTVRVREHADGDTESILQAPTGVTDFLSCARERNARNG